MAVDGQAPKGSIFQPKTLKCLKLLEMTTKWTYFDPKGGFSDKIDRAFLRGQKAGTHFYCQDLQDMPSVHSPFSRQFLPTSAKVQSKDDQLV
jgi:hypothetical protein